MSARREQKLEIVVGKGKGSGLAKRTRVKWLINLAIGLSVLCLATPAALYAWGLSLVEARPVPPANLVTAKQGLDAWQYIEDDPSGPHVPKLNPWTVAFHYLRTTRPTDSLTLQILARNHVRDHLQDYRVIAWHISVASIAIWVSRNWTEEQVLAELHRLYGGR